MIFRARVMAVLIIGVLAASCAAPALTLYTLGAPHRSEPTTPFGRAPTVIAVDRVTLPDYLDSQDIQIRRASVLANSRGGRWASRLSLGATELLTQNIADRRPDALVTNQPQTSAPSYRIRINISRLDLEIDGVGPGGRATLEADWLIVPADSALPARRDRVAFSLMGPLDTDLGIVALTSAALTRLAAAIDVAGLR